jgi:hypothetical protein
MSIPKSGCRPRLPSLPLRKQVDQKIRIRNHRRERGERRPLPFRTACISFGSAAGKDFPSINRSKSPKVLAFSGTSRRMTSEKLSAPSFNFFKRSCASVEIVIVMLGTAHTCIIHESFASLTAGSELLRGVFDFIAGFFGGVADGFGALLGFIGCFFGGFVDFGAGFFEGAFFPAADA